MANAYIGTVTGLLSVGKTERVIQVTTDNAVTVVVTTRLAVTVGDTVWLAYVATGRVGAWDVSLPKVLAETA